MKNLLTELTLISIVLSTPLSFIHLHGSIKAYQEVESVLDQVAVLDAKTAINLKGE